MDEEFIVTHADRAKIIQLLNRYRNLSEDAPLSSAARCFSIDSTSPGFVSELFQELENIDVGDLSKEGTAKNFSNFLIDLAEAVPDVMLQNIYHVLPHLDDECYTLRNAVLAILTELIQSRLQSEHLDDDDVETRDKFLQHLEDHIHDKNAFVRSKVTQLWSKLAETGKFPEGRLETLLPRIVGRLMDKASTVRKGAVHFLTALLKANPDMEAIRTLYQEEVIPRVSAMLRQQETSDMLEAVEFVVTCNELGIQNASEAFWECCRLIWSKEQTVKDAVIRAFQRLFLSYHATETRTKDEAIAKSLISLILQADVSQLTSLEEIVSDLTKRQLISPAVCQILWEQFAMRFPDGNSYAESKASLKLISMMAKAEKSVIRENMDILIEHGLGERAANDFELAADAVYALEKLFVMPKAKAEEALRMVPFRLNDDNDLFKCIKSLIADGYVRLNDPFWTPMTERAIRLVFAASDHPNEIAATILGDVLEKFKETADADLLNGRLLRMLVLIGQVALQTFINLDVAVCREMKRRNLLKEELRSKRVTNKVKATELVTPAKGNKKKLPIKTPRSKVSTVSLSLPTIDVSADDELNAMVGSTAEDEEYEFVSRLCEEAVLSDNSVLGQLSKIVIFVCHNPHKYHNDEIQAAASLALSKLMLVTSKFAESNIQLFFTLLDRSEWAAVRANLVIAFGDLSFRFPNLVEPWTSTVYQRLHDAELNVRLNCLLVLNHLILNDMIKPKGFVANIAKCTLDGNIHVANLAKKFFAEYAGKGNALYNVLPDIISRLSDPDGPVPFDDFKSILKFLFALIHKERQFESMVEKLCQRFLITSSVDQWRRLSFCLSLITYNDRTLRKLQENTNCFASKLGDGEVYKDFQTILNSAKKSCKQGSGEDLLNEMEEKIFTLHRKYDEDYRPAAATSADPSVPPVRKFED